MTGSLILIGCLAQVAILQVLAPWPQAAATGLALTAFVTVFAFTTNRWDPHVDMVVVMAGLGGLGMTLGLLPAYLQGLPACHAHQTLSGYALMTIGMLALSIPFCWNLPCLQRARLQGIFGLTLALDIVGMQIGMTLGYLPASLLPTSNARPVWLHHGLMLLGMLLGMTAGMLLAARISRLQTRRSSDFATSDIS